MLINNLMDVRLIYSTDLVFVYECHPIDSSEIPSLWEMQSSLLNESSEDVLVPLGQSLLLSALEDPGCEGPDVSCLSFLEWSNNILWVNKIHLKKMQKKVNHTSGAKLFSCHPVRIHLPTQILLTYYVIKKNLILGSLDGIALTVNNKDSLGAVTQYLCGCM